jgi:hypothetical protein
LLQQLERRDMARTAQAELQHRLDHEAQTLCLELPVVLRVQMAVRGLLADEGAHGGPQARIGDGARAGAHAVDEELLAQRKGHRQRVEQLGAKRVAGDPVARKTGRHVRLQVAHDDVAHGLLLVGAFERATNSTHLARIAG